MEPTKDNPIPAEEKRPKSVLPVGNSVAFPRVPMVIGGASAMTMDEWEGMWE